MNQSDDQMQQMQQMQQWRRDKGRENWLNKGRSIERKNYGRTKQF